MTDDATTAQVVRRHVLSSRQRDLLPIYDSDAKQIDAIVAEVVWAPSSNPTRERFVLMLRGPGGDEVEMLPFDTLEIALDQAKEIADINPGEWQVLSEPVDWA